MRWFFLLFACAACSSHPLRAATSEPASASPGRASSASAEAPAARPIFGFHSGRWTQLHHWLHYAATARRPAPKVAPEPPDTPAWDAAVDFYRAEFGPKGGFGVIFDEGLIDTHRSLSHLAAGERPTDLAPEHAQHLVATAALVDWAAEDARNQSFIASLEPLVAAHGEPFVSTLEDVYATDWPPRPIRVDVSCFAGPVGAYTVGDPVHITISSCDPDYGREGALEMIFHEASHALSDRLEAKISAAARRRGQEPPRNLWHAVIFYTTGELARERLGSHYRPYAERRGLWGGAMGPRKPLATEWQPYLDGERDLDEAVEALVARALAVDAAQRETD